MIGGSRFAELTGAIQELAEAQEATNALLREVLGTVLQVAQTQAEVSLRQVEAANRLVDGAVGGPTPELREPVDGEAFAWSFDEQGIERDPRSN